MIIYDCKQGEPEWFKARMGVITSSDFSKIITPKTMKLSSSHDMIANKVVAQRITGEDETDFTGNKWTERGHELEPEAASMYELINEVETTTIGFATRDDGLVGCSPDRFVGDQGGLEIKCPAAHTHLASFFANSIADDHKCQVQGCLLITGFKWWDVMSYHPNFPPSIIRVERDEEFIDALDKALALTLVKIEEKLEKLKGN